MDYIKIYCEEDFTEMGGGGQNSFGFDQGPETLSFKNNKEVNADTWHSTHRSYYATKH